MAANTPRLEKGSGNEMVTVSNWTACRNSGDNMIALSCTVTSADGTPAISGVGLILNTEAGVTVASFYVDCSGGSKTVNPALNLPPGSLTVGEKIWGVVSGECGEMHYFFEEELTIGNC